MNAAPTGPDAAGPSGLPAETDAGHDAVPPAAIGAAAGSAVQHAHRLLHSRSDFREALREGLARAAVVGCRELFLCDVDFSDWPLGEIAVVESLSRWALAHRRLTLLAQSFDDVQRRHPRFAAWRRQWSHVVTCRAFEDAEPGQMPSVLLAPGLVTVRLFDARAYRASVSTDPADALRAKELLDALLQHSVEAFPASTLGL